jgi:hypothetical protein
MKLLTPFKKIRHQFASPLPIGMEAFDAWCEKIFTLYKLPDNPSYRHAIATMIMHLGPTKDKAPLSYFAKSVRKAMSNQIAHFKMKEINEARDKQDQLEATTKEESLSEVQN